MKILKKTEFIDKNGKVIKDIISIVNYLEGIVVLTKKGTIYTDVKSLTTLDK